MGGETLIFSFSTEFDHLHLYKKQLVRSVCITNSFSSFVYFQFLYLLLRKVQDEDVKAAGPQGADNLREAAGGGVGSRL